MNLVTQFDLESEVLDVEYESTLDKQEIDLLREGVANDVNAITYEMDSIDSLFDAEENLPTLNNENPLVNNFAMECAVGVTGTSYMGVGADMEDNFPATVGAPAESAGGWKDKIVKLYEVVKTAAINLFSRIKDFVSRIWTLATDKNARLINTLTKLRKEVEATNAQPSSPTMKRGAGNSLSRDANGAIKDINTANVIFNEFSTKVYDKAIEFCSQFIAVVVKRDREFATMNNENGPRVDVDGLTKELEPLGRLLDFSSVSWLIKGVDSQGDRKFAHTDTIMGKWVATIADSGVSGDKPQYVIPTFVSIPEPKLSPLGDAIEVPDKSQLLSVIDATIKLAQAFDRSLSIRLRRLTAFRLQYLAVIDRKYNTLEFTKDRVMQERQVILAVKTGIRLLHTLLSTSNQVVSIHTQAVTMGTNYALSAFRLYK